MNKAALSPLFSKAVQLYPCSASSKDLPLEDKTPSRLWYGRFSSKSTIPNYYHGAVPMTGMPCPVPRVFFRILGDFRGAILSLAKIFSRLGFRTDRGTVVLMTLVK